MKRSFLTALGLEKTQIDQIMDEHGNTVEALKEKHGDMLTAEKDKLQKKIDALEGEKATLEKQAKEAPASAPDGEDWKQKYDDEVKAHQATKDGYTAEKDAEKVDALVAAQLKASGMNEKAIPKALKLYDRAIVERDKDGGIKNADKVLEAFKAEWADFFGEVKQQGADVGDPPAGNIDADPFIAGFKEN